MKKGQWEGNALRIFSHSSHSHKCCKQLKLVTQNFIKYVNCLDEVSYKVFEAEGVRDSKLQSIIFPIFDYFQDLKPVVL